MLAACGANLSGFRWIPSPRLEVYVEEEKSEEEDKSELESALFQDSTLVEGKQTEERAERKEKSKPETDLRRRQSIFAQSAFAQDARDELQGRKASVCSSLEGALSVLFSAGSSYRGKDNGLFLRRAADEFISVLLSALIDAQLYVQLLEGQTQLSEATFEEELNALAQVFARLQAGGEVKSPVGYRRATISAEPPSGDKAPHPRRAAFPRFQLGSGASTASEYQKAFVGLQRALSQPGLTYALERWVHPPPITHKISRETHNINMVSLESFHAKAAEFISALNGWLAGSASSLGRTSQSLAYKNSVDAASLGISASC